MLNKAGIRILATIALCGALPLIAHAASGRASWTVTNPDSSTYTFRIVIHDDRAAEISSTGTNPPTGTLPLTVYNGDGEDLRLSLAAGGTLLKHDGHFAADWDPQTSDCNNRTCAGDACGTDSVPNFYCEDGPDDYCLSHECGGGGGVITVMNEFTASLPYPY